MDSIARIYESVDGSRREGRLENVLQRRNELQCIFQALKAVVPRLVKTRMTDDASLTESSILLDCCAALHFLREVHTRLDIASALDQEQRSERGVDDTARTIIPLTSAIAAGNTPILILDPHGGTIANFLYKLLLGSGIDLEATGLLMLSSDEDRKTAIKALSQRPIQGVVVQTAEDLAFVSKETDLFRASPTCQIINAIQTPLVVAVTRHGDIRKAAAHIARATSNSGKDRHLLVLIDEAVFVPFQEAMKNNGESININVNESTEKAVQAIFLGVPKYRTSAIRTFTTSGSEALLSLMGSMSPPHVPAYPSVAIYSNSSEARYLSLFMETSSVFINQIPPLSLFTPSQHSFVDLVLERLYSRPSPIQVQQRRELYDLKSTSGVVQFKSLIEREHLVETKRPTGNRMGFFPQGGLIGLSHSLVLLGTIGWFAWSWTASRLK